MKISVRKHLSLVPAMFLLLLLSVCGKSFAVEPAGFPGKKTLWNGFDRFDFPVEEFSVMVIAPQKAATGNPWVWHGEFFGHKPAPDIALLKKGFHIAYMKVPNMLGSPQAVENWNLCYRELTQKHGLAKKVALVGLSRGGLYCYNWATANPDQVACIFGDAPVCDFKSWPGGKGKGKGSPADWKRVMDQYGFQNEEQAIAYDKNPIDNLAVLAKHDVPLLHVYGEADDVVPWDENTGIIASRYRKLGGRIDLIVKPGVGHHPHSLNDPSPIVDFIERNASVGKPRSLPVHRKDPVGKLSATLEPSKRVVYKTVDGHEMYLHLFEPDGCQPGDQRSCFLFIHGGGWAGGYPRMMYPYAAHFSEQGMVCISLEYRLLNNPKGTTVFDCVKDGRSAVRFVRSHAKSLGIDPHKIIVSGASAGGHVAVGTALFDGIDEPDDALDVSCVPDAMVLLYPVIDTSEAGYGNKKAGPDWRKISPVHNVRSNLPPTIIFHGTGDTVTPFPGAKKYQELAVEKGNRCELDIHEGGRHGYLIFDEKLYRETLVKIEAFLKSVE
ncbi:MAG: alpha/beta hydrolase fold domain-containing protein [Planctomycetaceae bacterium]|nr:alpha/beta hydrolase fold domain-containing protein [Planctomycetaceae bacterium]